MFWWSHCVVRALWIQSYTVCEEWVIHISGTQLLYLWNGACISFSACSLSFYEDAKWCQNTWKSIQLSSSCLLILCLPSFLLSLPYTIFLGICYVSGTVLVMGDICVRYMSLVMPSRDIRIYLGRQMKKYMTIIWCFTTTLVEHSQCVGTILRHSHYFVYSHPNPVVPKGVNIFPSFEEGETKAQRS